MGGLRRPTQGGARASARGADMRELDIELLCSRVDDGRDELTLRHFEEWCALTVRRVYADVDL